MGDDAPPFLAIEKFQSPSVIPHLQMTTERGGACAIMLGIFFSSLVFPFGRSKNFGCHSIINVVC